MTSGSHGSQGHMLKLYWEIFETAWTHAVPAIKRIGKLEAEIDDLREEVAMLNTMLDSLSDVLEAKGITTQEIHLLKTF